MPLNVPPPTQEPFSDLAPEIRIQRKNTHRFIAADPTDVSLTPRVETKTAAGGTAIADGLVRPPQRFRVIPASHTERPSPGAAAPASGQQRRHDFTLLGEWDAVMEPGDWWQDERGERWVIDEMVPHNGYETRGLITSFGKTR